MKHKTWFRLVLKAIGVLLACLGLPQVVSGGLRTLALLTYQSFGMPSPPWSQIMYYVAPEFAAGTLQAFLGTYLFFGGRWIVEKCIPSNRPYCPNCGYELKSLTSSLCPECGIVLPPDVRPPPIVGQK
ncbi:MAG TPA: hypothetical protein VG711_00550 [Phycisphaerales bacterium]|nr:hypothetical protein [Phycisphaerales bacterium]